MKVLVISANAFSKTSNNGKTLEAFFSKFNKEELALLFFRPTAGKSYDYSFASSNFHMSDMDVIHSFIHFEKKCGEEVSDIVVKTQSQNAKIYKKVKNPMRSSRVLFRDLIWSFFPRWKKGGLLEWAKKQSPDVIFAYLAGGKYMYDVLDFLHSELHIPFVVFYGDDYIIYKERKTLLDRILYKKQKSYYSKAIQNASACFCIGELMAKDYSSFFGRSFTPIMNSVPITNYVPRTPNIGKEVVFSYLGGLHLNRWKMLSILSHSLPQNAVLHIYSGTALTDEMKVALNKSNICMHKLIPAEQVPEVMRNSDILVHVESDDLENRLYTRLSVSTKIPEYLMAGRMVLGMGPAEVASMRLISDNELGIVISSDMNETDVATVIRNICNDENMRDSYGKKAHDYACRMYDKETITSSFRNKLENIVNLK